MTKKLRLVKVLVQASFVLDDDETGTLSEIVTDPVVIPAADWPGYSEDGFVEATAALREQLEGKPDDS